MSRNVDYAHFDVDVMEHEKICALIEEGGADAYLAWQALICRARRALDPDNPDRAGIITVPVARRVLGALGMDAKAMVGLLERHRLLDALLVPGEWMIHDFWEHQHIDGYLTRMDRNKRGGITRGAQLRAQAQAKAEASGQPRLEASLSPNPTQPNPTTGELRSPETLPAADAAFQRFYSVYPRKKEPKEARRAWDKAILTTPPQVIVAGAERYAEQRRGQDPKLTKYPATWLNRGCWDDEPDDDYQDEPAVREGGTF